MSHTIRLSLFIVIALVGATLLAACAGQRSGPQMIGDSSMTPLQLQAELTALGDDLIARVNEAVSEMGRGEPDLRQRRIAHSIKLATAEATITNIGGPSPMAALLDMTVMTTLMRMKLEENAARAFGEKASILINAFRRAEEDHWELASEVMSETELEQLRLAIREWNIENQDMTFVSKVRLSEFAGHRANTPTEDRPRLPSNLLRLFYLDPLSGLDPTVRELEQARLLAERVIYQAQRMPRILRWETEALYYDLVSNVGTQELLKNIDEAAGASVTVADLAANLPDLVAQERAATIEQIERAVERQRAATIDDLRLTFVTESRALIDEFNKAQAPLQGSLTQLDSAIVSADGLATQLNELVRASDNLISKLGLDKPSPRPADEPPGAELERFEQTTAQVQSAAVDLTDLVVAMTRLVESPALQDPQRITAATTQASDEFFDDVVRAGLILIGVGAAALLAVLVVNRLLGYALEKRRS